MHPSPSEVRDNDGGSVLTHYTTACLSIWYYFAFGALHEIAHALVACSLDLHHGALYDGETIAAFLARITIGRALHLPMLESAADEESVLLIRHAGWLVSVLIALVVSRFVKQSHIRNAAIITAMEAIATDLFCFGNSYDRTVLFCGNFGLILVNPAWISGPDGGETALKILKKLVEVTMMRGAQSGGVVCWTNSGGGASNNNGDLRGIRSRVVNGKRTTLSQGVYDKVHKDAFANGKLKPGIQGFFGHTRFATSSKATFDGTHPHQWSSPRAWRVFDANSSKSKTPEARLVSVENFITHNGDLDFFRVGSKFYDTSTVQVWLEKATGNPMPATVDSAAIAGIVDLIRTAGSFGLSARYALLVGASSCVIDNANATFPSSNEFEIMGQVFEKALVAFCKSAGTSINAISYSEELRDELAVLVLPLIAETKNQVRSFAKIISSENDAEKAKGVGQSEFIRGTIDAFFDNDLFQTTKLVLENAKGSFGLTVTSSLDARRRVCVAARGQTMSIAFYPKKGIICYGSEQAAVKAGMNYDCVGSGDRYWDEDKSTSFFEDEAAARIDLDDLGGEICLMDWGNDNDSTSLLSYPNRFIKLHSALHGKVKLAFHQQSKVMDDLIHRRLTVLEENEFITPLPDDCDDPVLRDIQDIPKVCKDIQEKWYGSSINRLTAWNFSRCLRARLELRAMEKLSVNAGTVDILLTGCEVSLWLAEQFASDLQKAFPKLFIKTVSSNKMLGLYGQDLSIPTLGHSMSQHTHDLSDAIVIIVSHSGGTFAPLACSNLLQSKTKNMFVVTSEWDTQIGKQLRGFSEGMLDSRIFTTDVGVRPAEPCSVSVAAQHQLLTQLFETISLTILQDKDFRRVAGAVISETDVKVLKRCNKENISALEKIVGTDVHGNRVVGSRAATEKRLRDAGRLWSDHVLENARAHVMTFVYIIITVTIGYPLITGLSVAGGLNAGYAFYITRFLDAWIYFFLPQINITILRLVQKRNLRHRMVGRTVVVGDIPWVSQSADAFLSKLFACSYSIAGLNVLSGNPADHLVHRHTHRVVRGSLLVCGRPDGRLMALTSAEATVSLSVSQASSIQSVGGTCESVTIGHNPSKMTLTKNDIFLESHRPQFFCERLLEEEHVRQTETSGNVKKGQGLSAMNTSPNFLIGTYSGWAHDAQQEERKAFLTRKMSMDGGQTDQVGTLVETMIREKGEYRRLKRIFTEIDYDNSGTLNEEEFIEAYSKIAAFPKAEVKQMFHDLDVDGNGCVDFEEFRMAAAAKPEMTRGMRLLDQSHHSHHSNVEEEQIEEYFGEAAREKSSPTRSNEFSLCESQTLSMELYEGRIASMQRFVAMTVMFHEMGSRTQRFFPRISFGYLGYRMDRTHSIMRIATTASPVSGADVRERMERLKLMGVIQKAVNTISNAYSAHRQVVVRGILESANVGFNKKLDVESNSRLYPSAKKHEYRRVSAIISAPKVMFDEKSDDEETDEEIFC